MRSLYRLFSRCRASCGRVSLPGISLCFLAMFALVAGSPAQAQRYRYKQTIGVYDLGTVHSPNDVAIDPSGNVYIVDQAGYCIQKFDPNGNYLLAFGRYGYGDGEFAYPNGIATDSAGSVYVTDSANDTIQKFDPNGNHLLTISGFSDSLYGIAVDSAGSIYVTDYQTVRKFDSAGNPLLSFGTFGSATGQFDNPEGIAVDGSGNIYVSDTFNDRVQKFNSSGAYLTTIGAGSGAGNGQFSEPQAICLDAAGNLYVADQNNGRIEKFNSSGNFVSQFSATATGTLGYPTSVKFGAGRLYVANGANTFIFNTAGGYVGQIGSQLPVPGGLYRPNAVRVDASGNVYVLDTGNSRVEKYDHNGNYLLQFSSQGSANSRFWATQAMALDHSAHVYVLDSNRIYKFDSSGNFITAFGGSGSGLGQFNAAQRIALDASDNVYVTDSVPTGITRVEKFASSGTPLTQFNIPYGTGTGQASGVSAIAVDGAGSIYVQDTGNSRILKFDAQGNFLSTFGTPANPFNDMQVDASGNVYVTSTSQVQKFAPNGTLLTEFGSDGSDPGQFNGAQSMALTPNGNVYIVDQGNARVEVFFPVRFDLDLDGNTDFLWQNTTNGDVSYWLMNGITFAASGYMAQGIPLEWKIVGALDIFNNGKPVLLWQNTQTGDVSYWITNGLSAPAYLNAGYLARNIPLEWKLVGTPDLNGDGKPDLVWQNTTTGDVSYWLMNGLNQVAAGYLARNIPLEWKIVGTPDLDGDGKPDLLWQSTRTGDVSYWLMNGLQTLSTGFIAHGIPLEWKIMGTPDLDGDGKSDLLWRNTVTGDVSYWLMNGLTPGATGYLARFIPLEWQLAPVY